MEDRVKAMLAEFRPALWWIAGIFVGLIVLFSESFLLGLIIVVGCGFMTKVKLGQGVASNLSNLQKEVTSKISDKLGSISERENEPKGDGQVQGLQNSPRATAENCDWSDIKTIIVGLPCDECGESDGHALEAPGFRICKLCGYRAKSDLDWQELISSQIKSGICHIVGDGHTLMMPDDWGAACGGMRPQMTQLFGLHTYGSRALGAVGPNSSGLGERPNIDPKKITRINDGRNCPKCRDWNEPFWIREQMGGYYHTPCHYSERIMDKSWEQLVQEAVDADYVMYSGSMLIARNAIEPGMEKLYTDLHGKKLVPGGCFIATVAFGDIEHPDVVQLRQFRDARLNHGAFGRAFVRSYYAVSPYLARKLNSRQWLKQYVRSALSWLVKKLPK